MHSLHGLATLGFLNQNFLHLGIRMQHFVSKIASLRYRACICRPSLGLHALKSWANLSRSLAEQGWGSQRSQFLAFRQVSYCLPGGMKQTLLMKYILKSLQLLATALFWYKQWSVSGKFPSIPHDDLRECCLSSKSSLDKTNSSCVSNLSMG